MICHLIDFINAQEQWKPIPKYEGFYEASNFGRIRTDLSRTSYQTKKGVRKLTPKVLKPKKDKQNSLRVTLWKNGESKDYLVARLVCTTWHENLIDTKMTVNHKDGNRLNNTAENLEWLSRADNIKHGFQNNLYPQKNTALMSLETGNIFCFKSQTKASEALGRHHGYINECVKRRKLIVEGKDGKKYLLGTEV
jgi:hypothetical protein